EMLPDEVLRVSFRGSRGQEAWLDIKPGKKSLQFIREDFDDYSLYQAELPVRNFAAGVPHTLSLRIVPAAGAPVKETYRPGFTRTITVRNPEDFPLLKVKNDYSRLVYNLGAPRLGGPIRSELGPGVVLKSSGKIGRNYRIRLSNTETGFISEEDVELLSGSRIQPVYSVTSMSCGPSERGDVVSIPYLAPVPYEVMPDPDGKRLVVTLFGVESAATWVSHRTGCRVIEKLTWEQTTPETFRVYVNLKTDKIWGYDIRPSGRSLVLRVKNPPVYDSAADKPLAGLKIAIEAGHGGSGTGAIGLSGLVEKDINLDLSFRLGELCAAMGAGVLQVRDRDIDMTLIEKRDIAIRSGADMLISIHANAGGRGYLSVAGTSTYWHNPFWAPLAQTIYDRLLETGLEEFGVVGAFNYTVTRASQLPAVLVEQAFMTHAEDEEKLAEPEFRQQMAVKIVEGIIDYLQEMQE
ncbi:MAG: N-acetylmuramoyl-L-alanine amidase, partial [Bacteroidales bacterium]|nr:N-acetylmuramoyl-L-alanine amidase [Bacteroidales bacterium]